MNPKDINKVYLKKNFFFSIFSTLNRVIVFILLLGSSQIVVSQRRAVNVKHPLFPQRRVQQTPQLNVQLARRQQDRMNTLICWFLNLIKQSFLKYLNIIMIFCFVFFLHDSFGEHRTRAKSQWLDRTVDWSSTQRCASRWRHDGCCTRRPDFVVRTTTRPNARAGLGSRRERRLSWRPWTTWMATCSA